MEYLRWVLLAAGIVFILFIYLRERARHRNDYEESFYDDDLDDDYITAQDELDEIVNDVKMSARDDSYDEADDCLIEAEYEQESFDDEPVEEKERNVQGEVITLGIIARTEKLSGDQINSVARACGLVFGYMDIFHYLDEDDEIIFSLADMYEPGSFDPQNLHEHETRGLLVFMQPELLKNPSRDFDDMLEITYRMSELLGAQLSNDRREPFTERDAENYRTRVASYDV